jgi:diadenosine tetraphosphate (Ap4A) HIT family hydrolase
MCIHSIMTGPISSRVAQIAADGDPSLIATLASGYAILNDNQPDAITGCCVLLPANVVPSINDLNAADRAQFMDDLLMLGDAVLEATGAERINYLVLCNMAPELHAHVIPRFANEERAKRKLGPFEAYDFAASRPVDPTGQDADLLNRLRIALR